MKELFNQLPNGIRSFIEAISKAQDSSSLVKEYAQGSEDTKLAALSYIPFAAAAILVFRKSNSEFISFHARHSLILLLLAMFTLLILPTLLKILVVIVIYAIFVFGAYKASRGEKWYFPIVTELANSIDL